MTGESIIPPDNKVQEWWFFCLQTPQQGRRSTPSGFWKKTGTDRNVKARDTHRVIGTKKTLVFHKGRGSNGISTKWVIHEYHLLANEVLNLSLSFICSNIFIFTRCMNLITYHMRSIGTIICRNT